MTKEAPRYILDCMIKATVPVFFTLVTTYTEISTVLAVLWSNIVTFAILRMKAVFGKLVISTVVIAAASSFADFFGNANPSTVSTFFDVDGTTFVS